VLTKRTLHQSIRKYLTYVQYVLKILYQLLGLTYKLCTKMKIMKSYWPEECRTLLHYRGILAWDSDETRNKTKTQVSI